MAQVGDPDFHLKSENHVSALVQKFHILLEKETLVDVTLSTTEGQYLKAHRLVLLASSQFFEELFTLPPLNDTSLAEITLPQIGYEDLKIVVQYMYRGEITVPRHQLPSLLETASTLKIPDLIGQLQEVMAYYEQSNDSFNPLQLQRSDDYAAIDSRSKVPVFAAISNEPQTGLMDDEVGGYGITFVAPADQHQLPFLETVDGDPLLSNQDDVSTNNNTAADPLDPGWDDGARPMTRAEFLAAKAEYIEWKAKQLHPVASKPNEDQGDAAQVEDTMEENMEHCEPSDLNQPTSLDTGVDESSSTAPSSVEENFTLCSKTGPTPSMYREQNDGGEEKEEDEEENLTSSEDYSQDSSYEYESEESCDDEDFKTPSSTTRPSKRKRESSAKPSSKPIRPPKKGNVDTGSQRTVSQPPFKCTKCQKEYKRKNTLTRHIQYECDMEPRFPCSKCDLRFRRMPHLQRHLVLVHKIKPSQFATLGAGPKPRPEMPFKCDRCEKSFETKQYLRNHKSNVCGVERTFHCSFCNYKAKVERELRRHIGRVHQDNPSTLAAC